MFYRQNWSNYSPLSLDHLESLFLKNHFSLINMKWGLISSFSHIIQVFIKDEFGAQHQQNNSL